MIEKKKLFRNNVVDKKQLKQIMTWSFREFGIMKASYLATKLKDIGFHYATQGGLSISIEDLRVPPIKATLINSANEKVYSAELEVKRGEITEVERFQKVINTWNTTSENLKDQVVQYFKETDPLNSIYMMAFSGARGNLSQVRQLVGMRGLMADFNGQIIDLPIVTNFREGLTVTDYIISSYGARKGLVDTALRTADSGYLTRKLVDVAQSLIVRQKNCKTKNGISLTKVVQGSNVLISLEERILGRLLALPLTDKKTGQIIAEADDEIDINLAQAITKANILKVIVRSPLTCSSSRSICQQCYGWNLAYGNIINLGEAVGIIAAQSIGEPGTQLTMRTFHTGGVFTTEQSRQIRAQFSGKFIFSKILKTQKTRTQYGQIACTSQNKASLTLKSYSNKSVEIEILPETLILAENNSYVKKNQIIFELPSKTKKTRSERTTKDVYANFSGQVILEDKKLKKVKYLSESITNDSSNYLLWVLSGQVYNIPLNSIIKVKSKTSIRKGQVLAEAKLISVMEGTIKLRPKKKDLNILYNSTSFKNLNLYFEENEALEGSIKPVIYGNGNKRIILNFQKNPKLTSKTYPILGTLINLNYRTKTGGLVYTANFSNKEKFSSPSNFKLKIEDSQFINGGTLLYVPESTYQLEKEISQLYVKAGDYIYAGKELFKDTFASISGVVDIKVHKKIAKVLTIKPARIYQLEKKRGLKNFQQKLVFPGEILFNSIEVLQLSFIEVKTINGQAFLRIYPIVRYEIINEPNELSAFLPKALEVYKDVEVENLKFQFEKKIEGNSPVQLIKRQLLCRPRSVSKSFRAKLKFSFKLGNLKKLELNILVLEKIILDQYLPKELRKVDSNVVTLVDKNQYTEPYTVMSSFQVLSEEKSKITKIKEQLLKKERKLLLVTNTDYKKIFAEDANIFFKEDELVKVQEKTRTNLLPKNSGLVSNITGNTVFIQIGQPYLFSQGGTILKYPGDLIAKGESLGKLAYEVARTGDIIQGLPLVVKILEARKPKIEAKIVERPGIVAKISSSILKRELSVWIASPFFGQLQKEEYITESSQRLLIGKFEFINVGQPLTDASINPHTLLKIYFDYYKSLNFLSPYQSAYRSLRKLQAFLLNSIQAVYYSQGVSISDKHVEIIVKQMTGKVQITSSGESNLLEDEFLDLHQVFSINKSLGQKENAQFCPVLFGITKASLKTSSFVSAASFQSTIRVLTEAAIQGKTDWLRGLKENVIVGRLIPAGTGFTVYNDLSHLKVKVPYLNTITEIENHRISSSPHKKYSALKNRIKFQII